jgi:hypothetical protein
MSNLYQEAIADARKLREMAEAKAKNKIIDAVTPKIQRIIEAQLREGDDDLVDLMDDELVSPDSDIDGFDDFDDEAEELEKVVDEPIDMDVSADVDSDGFSSIEIVDDGLEDIEEESSDDASDKSIHVNITVENRNRRLRRAAIQLTKALAEAKTPRQVKMIREKLNKVRKALIITENGQNVRLANNLTVILKESRMRRRKNSWLFEGEDFGKDGADFEDVEFDDAGFEDEGENEIVDALETLGVDVEMLKAELGGEDDMAMGKDGDFMGKDGADFEDVEFDDVDFDDDMELEGYMAEGDDKEDDDEVVEIDESMLRSALRGSSRRRSPRATRRARSLRESRRSTMGRRRTNRRRIFEGEAKAMAKHFGGGKLGKEMFVEVSEEALLNALAEELGNYGSAFKTGNASKGASAFGGGSVQASKALKEARRARRVAKINEAKAARNASVARKQARVARAAKAELKESNLFNTKLLYVTKIMQEHTLNKKQQRAIVEAMDNAQTQREAKLLFTSLNESLNKRKLTESRKARQTLNESKSSTGSSSTLLRSGQAPRTSVNEVKLDRWAVLAGINK